MKENLDPEDSLKERAGTHASPRTVQRCLHEKNFKKFLKTKKPYVSQVNCRKRLQCSSRYLHWTVDEWKKDVWSDESPFVLRCQRRSCLASLQ